jgi:hypothetical protein
MQHSSIGPSSAKRIIACPGSVALVAKAPKQESSVYAEEGTRAHEVVEAYILGQPIPSWATDEMIDGAKMYAGVIEDCLFEIDNLEIPLKLEARVTATSLGENAYGTCDAYFIADKTAYVFDYKFGRGVKIEPEHNEQLMYYATAIRDTHHIDITTLQLYIVQPRNGGISVWKTDSKALDTFEKDFKAALKSNQLNISSSCKWCPALAFCPKQLEQIQEQFNIKADVPLKECPPIEDISAEQFKIYLDNVDLLESWVKAIRSQAFSAVSRGLIIDGYELTESLGNRKWKDEEFTKRNLARLYGPDLIYDLKLKSPAQMEKLIPKEEVDAITIREMTGKKLTRTIKQTPDLFEAFNVIGD